MGEPMTMVAAYRGTSVVTAGVDVASSRALHVRVSEHLDGLDIPGHRKRALYIGTVADFAELERLFHRFQVDWAVIDASPEERSARAVADRFPGRVYLGRYAERQRDPLDLDPERLIITARRSIVCDATIELIRTHQNLLPCDLPRDYIEHMTAPRRHIDKDQYDRDRVTYKSVGRDDYFHAEVYDFLATEVARAMFAVDARLAHDGELFSLIDELDFKPSNLDRPSMDYHPGPPERDEYDDRYFDW